jgi:hypothetical protein
MRYQSVTPSSKMQLSSGSPCVLFLLTELIDRLVRIWHGFQQSNLFSLHVQGSTAASTSSSRAITTIKQRRKIPGLDLKSTLNSLILRVGPMETAQELVDAGVPSGILISNENSDDWLLALGPGSHVKVSSQHRRTLIIACVRSLLLRVYTKGPG